MDFNPLQASPLLQLRAPHVWPVRGGPSPQDALSARPGVPAAASPAHDLPPVALISCHGKWPFRDSQGPRWLPAPGLVSVDSVAASTAPYTR